MCILSRGTADAEYVTCGWLQKQTVASASLIADAVREDAFKPYSNEEFDAAVKFLRKFARQRSGFVVKEIDTHPQWGLK